MVQNPPPKQEIWVQSLVGKIPWRSKWQPPPVFLPEKSHGQRNLAGCILHGAARVRHNLVTKSPQ